MCFIESRFQVNFYNEINKMGKQGVQQLIQNSLLCFQVCGWVSMLIGIDRAVAGCSSFITSSSKVLFSFSSLARIVLLLTSMPSAATEAHDHDAPLDLWSAARRCALAATVRLIACLCSYYLIFFSADAVRLRLCILPSIEPSVRACLLAVDTNHFICFALFF